MVPAPFLCSLLPSLTEKVWLLHTHCPYEGVVIKDRRYIKQGKQFENIIRVPKRRYSPQVDQFCLTLRYALSPEHVAGIQ